MDFEWKCIDDKMKDDFIARNVNYVLRCEEMDKKSWWWAVYWKDEEIDGSNRHDAIVKTEKAAKGKCEKAVKTHWITKIAGQKIAKINRQLDRMGYTFDQMNAFWNECIAIAKTHVKKS